QNNRVASLVDRIHLTTMNWYKDRLSETYGSKVDPYIWDFTLMLQAAIKEYIILAIKEDKNINSEKAVRFVVDRLEMLINHTKHVLTSDNMSEFEAFEENITLISPKEQIDQILEEAEKEIYRLRQSKEEQVESISAIQYLRKELDGKEPRKFIIKSLLLYLRNIDGFEPLVTHLETVLKSTDL